MALQVPLMMTGQKISTVTAMSQPGSPLLTTTAPTTAHMTTVTGGGTQQKVFQIQALPTMMPATGENGQKITVQLAKLITIPATHLAQCQLPGQTKVTAGTGAQSISLVGGAPLTLRTITPVSVPTTAVHAPATTTQVLRLVAQQPAAAAPATAPTPAPTPALAPAPAAVPAPAHAPTSVPAATVVVAAAESTIPAVATSESDVTIIKVEAEEDVPTQVVTDASTPSDS